MMYPSKASPPVLSGAVQLRVTVSPFTVAARDVGASGKLTTLVVVALAGALAVLVPWELIALTR